MRKLTTILLAFATMASITSCKQEKKAEEDIIVDKIVAKPQNAPQSMSNDERNGSVKWIGGADYTYNIVRKASGDLGVVENHGVKYNNNSITLSVFRSDGTQFFQKTFTKDNFSPVLPKQFKETGVLLGMVLDKVEGNALHFTVSVGSPDDTNEEFYYVTMQLDNFGNTSAIKYQE